MDALVVIFGTIAVVALAAFIGGLFEQNATAIFFGGLGLIVCALVVVPTSAASWRANGERLAQESAVCTEAGNLWAHDEEACITPDGWTIDVR
jgi:hypothetical protein